MKNEIAIVMAAGKGERMRPLTLTKAKPLVKVKGTAMIETVIKGLERRGVKKIYVVVGYLKEQFKYLEEKYTNLTLVENKEYETKNNASSIHTVADLMKESACFVCEADLCISDPSIFDAELTKSCYYGVMVKGYSEDWIFELTGDRLTRIGKGGTDLYNMCGVTYFTKEDAKVIAEAFVDTFKQPGHEGLYWDEVVDTQLKNIYMTINPITRDQIIEIDSVAELEAFDPNYKKYN